MKLRALACDYDGILAHDGLAKLIDKILADDFAGVTPRPRHSNFVE